MHKRTNFNSLEQQVLFHTFVVLVNRYEGTYPTSAAKAFSSVRELSLENLNNEFSTVQETYPPTFSYLLSVLLNETVNNICFIA
jgi:hypothetical protein